ncbi:hypothetical protein ACFLSJ_02025, partial [Verrucomicrobiota bacterium]
ERLKALQSYRNPPLEHLETMVTAAKEANSTAASEDLDDLREFYRGMSAELVLGPETVILPKRQVRFRDEVVTLNQRKIPRLKISYPPAWRVLAEQNEGSDWRGLFESLKSVLGVNEKPFSPEDEEGARV